MATPLKLRRQVFERDRGICKSCSADCEKIRRVFTAISSFEAQIFYAEILRLHAEDRIFWEADHIHEQAEGGPHEIDNMQTLCVACHREKSAKFMIGRTSGYKRKLKLTPEEEALIERQRKDRFSRALPHSAVPPVTPQDHNMGATVIRLAGYPANDIHTDRRTVGDLVEWVNTWLVKRYLDNPGQRERRLEPIQADEYFQRDGISGSDHPVLG